MSRAGCRQSGAARWLSFPQLNADVRRFTKNCSVNFLSSREEPLHPDAAHGWIMRLR
jgi:hypothetical protein